jgi:hypothetical protein
MKDTIKYILILIFVLTGCNPTDPGDDTPGDVADPTHGLIVFEFQMPDLDLPAGKLHKVDLSLARTADSLYRKQFISAANVSDLKQSYSFALLPGRYYYQAGVSCAARGDSCYYAGFPGGYLSIWWTMGWVDVDAGKTYTKNVIFQ